MIFFYHENPISTALCFQKSLQLVSKVSSFIFYLYYVQRAFFELQSCLRPDEYFSPQRRNVFDSSHLLGYAEFGRLACGLSFIFFPLDQDFGFFFRDTGHNGIEFYASL